jgi:hypothetical protein
MFEAQHVLLDTTARRLQQQKDARHMEATVPQVLLHALTLAPMF